MQDNHTSVQEFDKFLQMHQLFLHIQGTRSPITPTHQPSSGSVMDKLTRSLFRDFKPGSTTEYDISQNNQITQGNVNANISQRLQAVTINIMRCGHDINNHDGRMNIISLIKASGFIKTTLN